MTIRKRMTVRAGFMGFILIWLQDPCYSLEPPRSGELDRYTLDGSIAERLSHARKLANDKVSSRLIYNLARKYNLAPVLMAPPPAWQGGLPASGNPKTVVLLVDFPDYPHDLNITAASVAKQFFGEGTSLNYPYESLRSYYQRSSYNSLNIAGNVLDWYRAKHARSYYQEINARLGDGAGQEALMMEVIDHHNAQGHDFTQYDNNNDGVIESLFIKWTGPDNGWSGFWWAYQWSWHSNPGFMVDGKKLSAYVWSWIAVVGQTGYDPHVDIHETGHLLGLPDYYDYDPDVGPDGGVGGLDMMDHNWGDHNAFSKALLGWLTPTLVGSRSATITLDPSGTSPHAVMIMPCASGSLFGEFFIAQYRKRGAGNDPLYSSPNYFPGRPDYPPYPTDGLLIWHVDGTLDATGRDYLYNNQYTAHKLISLVEADGLGQIEASSAFADAGDFYNSPTTFGPTTNPNSNRYNGSATEVAITGLSASGGSSMSASFAVEIPPTSLLIDGFRWVGEGGSRPYTATATYDDGTTATVTPTWSENSDFATISTAGILNASAVTGNRRVTITASYTSAGVTASATKSVLILDRPQKRR